MKFRDTIGRAVAAFSGVKAKYDAGGNGRRIKAWTPPSTGPVRATADATKVRDRARDAFRNDWAASSAAHKWTNNLIGVGITPRWKKDYLNQLWAKFVRDADSYGVLDAYGLQTLATLSWYVSGEVFMRRRPRPIFLGLAVPVQFQLIESDYVPMLDATSWPGMPAGNRIVQGIELNPYDRRVAYWMHKEHPGDFNKTLDPLTLIRVPASEVSHIFEPKRPGQLRGVSELASTLVRLRSTMDYEDAVLDRQKLANLFVAFVKRAMPDAESYDVDPLTGLPSFYSEENTALARLEPGMTQQLLPGEDITFANPPEAGTTYSDYLRTTHMGTMAGQGLPYETASGDIRNVSDRTLRVIMVEFRRFARSRQYQLCIPMICQPMVEWFAQAGVLSGAIDAADQEEASNPVHSPEGWEYIHPVQDVQGKIAAIAAGLISRDQVISERGDDPRTVDLQRAESNKRQADLQIPTAPAAP